MEEGCRYGRQEELGEQVDHGDGEGEGGEVVVGVRGQGAVGGGDCHWEVVRGVWGAGVLQTMHCTWNIS